MNNTNEIKVTNVPVEMHEKLKHIAKKRGTSMAAIIKTQIREFLEKNSKELEKAYSS